MAALNAEGDEEEEEEEEEEGEAGEGGGNAQLLPQSKEVLRTFCSKALAELKSADTAAHAYCDKASAGLVERGRLAQAVRDSKVAVVEEWLRHCA